MEKPPTRVAATQHEAVVLGGSSAVPSSSASSSPFSFSPSSSVFLSVITFPFLFILVFILLLSLLFGTLPHAPALAFHSLAAAGSSVSGFAFRRFCP